jgi:tRNA A-37 threonylcarbamoyl transferase component Bud32
VIGEVIDRRYRIDAELGSGGMGVVYRATHTLIGKQTAIKVLRSQHARDEEAVQRFLQEARLASSIEHPHVVDLSDFGQLEDGRLYYVMELLEGRSLAAEIDLQGPLSPHRALRVALQVARGLGAAHAQGIVHRDLKPDNIFLCRGAGGDDHVKLFDFGIARAGDSRLTRPGAVLGTPEYMPPEQTMGMAVDGRADLYALGVILFEMLAGKVPLSAADVMELFQMQLSTQPPTLAQVVPELASLTRTQALLDRLLAKRAEDRPNDAEAVQLAILDAIAGDAPQETRRTTRAMGSGANDGTVHAAEPSPRIASGRPPASPGWIAPAPLVALAAPAPVARPTPAYRSQEDTTPMGSAVAAALAVGRAVDPADSSRMSTAPTLAMIAAAQSPAERPAERPGPAKEEAPRVTQPQSLVLTGARMPAPAPVPAPAIAPANAESPRRRPSIVVVTLGSALAAGVLTLGGVGIARYGNDDPSHAEPGTPSAVAPAAVAAPLERPAEASPRTPAPEPPTNDPESDPTPAADPPIADPTPPPIASPDVGSEPTQAIDAHHPAEPTEGKPKPRAKKPVTTASKAGSDAPSKASKADAPAGPNTDAPSGTAPAGPPATDDEPKRKPKRSIDLKDPFGTN